jgi:hypothetical protein
MVADILVLPNRYFSLTDENGRYCIQGRPGGLRLRVAHFGGRSKTRARRQATLTVDFTVRSA